MFSTPQASKHSSKCSGQTPLLGHGGQSAAGGGKQAPDHSKHTGLGEGLKGVEQEAESKYKGQQREGKGRPSHPPTGPSHSCAGDGGLSRLSVAHLLWVGTKSPAQDPQEMGPRGFSVATEQPVPLLPASSLSPPSPLPLTSGLEGYWPPPQ